MPEGTGSVIAGPIHPSFSQCSTTRQIFPVASDLSEAPPRQSVGGRIAKSSLSLLPEAASRRQAPEVGMHHKLAAHRKPRVDRKELLEFAPAVAAAAVFPVLWVISRRIRRHARR